VSEPIQEGILREIDEELRKDQLHKLWSRFGKILIGVAFVIIISVAGYKAWQYYDLTNRGELGERFASTLELTKKGGGELALNALKDFQAEASHGYKMLANFRAAAVMANGGDRQGAIAAYGKLAKDNSLDIIYRDLAILLRTIQQMNDSNRDSATLSKSLASLSDDNNPWRYSARELIAIIAKDTGNTAKAHKLFNALIDDKTTPKGIRLRAKELLSGMAK